MATTDYYTPTGAPATGAFAASAVVRSEFDDISDGFAKLPTLTAGSASRAVVAASNGLSLTLTTGTLALAGNFATTGAFNTTFVQGASISITLPVVAGTLATLAGTETLTNKTITSPTISGTVGGGATYSSITLTTPALGTPTSGVLTNCTGYPTSSLSGSISLTTQVTGVLPTANGGTNLSSFTSGGAVYASSTSVLTTGTLPVASGGTGVTSSTGSVAVVLSTSPTITTPTISGALTYGGVALSAAVTGTGNMVLSAGPTFTGTVTAAAISATTGAFSSTVTISKTTGPQLQLNGGTSNYVSAGSAGFGPPTFTTSSVGTKYILFGAVGASAADYAIGVDGNTFWSTVPNTGAQYLWYGGVTVALTLTGTGALTAVGSISAGTSVNTAAASGYLLDSVLAMNRSGAFTTMYDSTGNGLVTIGNLTDPTTYHWNTTHSFASRSGGTTFATINSTGIVIASGLALTVGNAYVATPQTSAGYIIIKDSGGTDRRVMIGT